jgi:hypothetical protein
MNKETQSTEREEAAKIYADANVPKPSKYDSPFYTTADRWQDTYDAYEAGWNAAHQFKQSPSDAQKNLEAELQKQIQEPQSGYVQTQYLPQNQISNGAGQGHPVKLNAIHCSCPYCSKDFDIQPALNTLVMRSHEMDAELWPRSPVILLGACCVTALVRSEQYSTKKIQCHLCRPAVELRKQGCACH